MSLISRFIRSSYSPIEWEAPPPSTSLRAAGHAGPEPLPGDLLEIVAERLAFGRRELGQVVALRREIERAAGGDLARVLDGVGRLPEELGHLGRGLEVELVRAELEPVRVGDLAVRLDADEDVLALGVLAAGEVDVVRRDERQVELAGDGHELGIDRLLRVEAVVHELDEEVARPEHRGVLPGRLFGLLGQAAAEPDRDLALETGREPDEAPGVGGQELLVDPGPVVEALEVALGDEPAEVPVPGLVLDEEDEVVVMDVGGRPGLLVEAALRGDIDLAAEDGLDAPGLGLLEELDGAEDVAVVGQGHGGHVLLVGRADEVARPSGSRRGCCIRNGCADGRTSVPCANIFPRIRSGPIPTRSSRAAWSSRRRRPG